MKSITAVGLRPLHPFGPNIGPCLNPLCKYCLELIMKSINNEDEDYKPLLEIQGELIAQLRISIRAERRALRLSQKKAKRLQNQVNELRERLVKVGVNPLSIDAHYQ